jgi:hypothetical protein
MIADCLPVLLCDRAGTIVAAAHAGWRGLSAGVLESTITAMGCEPAQLLAYLGPAIGPQAFEVGGEVRDAFTRAGPRAAECFRAKPAPAGTPEKWLADLYGLARQRLADAGLRTVYGGTGCTFSEPQRFFSHRRDRRTGRQAALIWLPPDASAGWTSMPEPAGSLGAGQRRARLDRPAACWVECRSLRRPCPFCDPSRVPMLISLRSARARRDVLRISARLRGVARTLARHTILIGSALLPAGARPVAPSLPQWERPRAARQC